MTSLPALTKSEQEMLLRVLEEYRLLDNGKIVINKRKGKPIQIQVFDKKHITLVMDVKIIE